MGPFAENTYLIIESGKALLIDPGFSTHTEFTSLKTSLSSEKADLIGVLLTHAHIDHVLGLNQVLQTYDVPVWLNHSDLSLWENVESQSAMFGVTATGFSFTPEPLDEQKGFTAGPFTMDVLYTPGHSPDHVSCIFPQTIRLLPETPCSGRVSDARIFIKEIMTCWLHLYEISSIHCLTRQRFCRVMDRQRQSAMRKR